MLLGKQGKRMKSLFSQGNRELAFSDFGGLVVGAFDGCKKDF
jgi:hypothetical protein